MLLKVPPENVEVVSTWIFTALMFMVPSVNVNELSKVKVPEPDVLAVAVESFKLKFGTLPLAAKVTVLAGVELVVTLIVAEPPSVTDPTDTSPWASMVPVAIMPSVRVSVPVTTIVSPEEIVMV